MDDPIHVKVQVVDLGIRMAPTCELLRLGIKGIDYNLRASSAEPAKEDRDTHCALIDLRLGNIKDNRRSKYLQIINLEVKFLSEKFQDLKNSKKLYLNS